MMIKSESKLTLDQPVAYQIKVPGHLDIVWLDSVDDMVAEICSDEENMPITLLACRVDQATLIGLLRRIYSLGLPLISVVCSEAE